MSDVTPSVGSAANWAERGLFGAASVFGVWALLTAAQAHFYRSLPVPAAPATTVVLPGEGVVDRTDPSGRHGVPAGTWVARLEAPSIGLAATVIEGSSDQQLARAAGHIEDTAYPGEPGNVGIAGHRDTTFRPVRKLKVGDLLRLTTTGGVFDYRVERAWVVEPDEVSVLDPTPTPALTLVTCYPFTFIGHAPQRYIVRATLDPRDASTDARFHR
jgi:LPXTG-site transpeptidase (sortase) family protein